MAVRSRTACAFLEAIDAVIGVWGAEQVGVRLSPATTMPGETPLDSEVMGTYGAYVDALSARGLLYIHDIEGVTQQTRDVPDGVDFSALRKRFSGAYIANNQYTLELAEEVLAKEMQICSAWGVHSLPIPTLSSGCVPVLLWPKHPSSTGMGVAQSATRTGHRCSPRQGRAEVHRRSADRAPCDPPDWPEGHRFWQHRLFSFLSRLS
jgi:hypothetical protein